MSEDELQSFYRFLSQVGIEIDHANRSLEMTNFQIVLNPIFQFGPCSINCAHDK